MTWFTETPWPPIFLGIVVSAALLVVWTATRRGSVLLAAAGVLLLCPGVYFLEQWIVTEAERVEEAVHGVTTAFQENDLDRTLGYFSPRATGLRDMVRAAHKLADVKDDLRITDLSVAMKPDENAAVSHFRASATVDVTGFGNAGYRTSRWEFTWTKGAGDWTIREVTRLNPITGEEMPLLKRSEQ